MLRYTTVDEVVLTLQLTGYSAFRQDGRELTLRPGDLTCGIRCVKGTEVHRRRLTASGTDSPSAHFWIRSVPQSNIQPAKSA